jgi:hypothetical protein
MLGLMIAIGILFILSVPVMVYLAILDYKIGMKYFNKKSIDK